MSKLACLTLFVVAVCLTSVCASEDAIANIDDVIDIFIECKFEHGVKAAEIHAVARSRDVTVVNPCLWSCVFKQTGFLDDKGKYVTNPGLTYAKKMVHNYEEYTQLENIVKQCESVKDKPVSDGEAGCQMGVLIAACFMEQWYMKFQRR